MSKKKKVEKKIVTKDTGVNVNTTFSANQTTPTNSNVVPTPAVGQSTGIIMGWPSPALFYQQGKDLAKKIYTEYLNAVNGYQSAEHEQYEPKMQQAGKMNALVQSMVQGVAIGTEAAESIMARLRTGDESARIEIEVVSDVIAKLLKTIWVHNTAAKSGKFAGLEVKLLEPQLTTRVRQSTGLETTDYGIALNSEEEADTIWVDQMMPSEQVPTLEEKPVDELGQVSAEDELTDGNTATDATLEPPMEEEIPNGSEESPLPPSEEEEEINPEDIFGERTEEEIPVNEEEIPVEDENIVDENGSEVIPEEETTEELPVEETEEVIPEEEVVTEQPQEDLEEPVDEDGLPLPSGPNGEYTKEDLIKYGEMIMGEMGSTDEEPVVDEEGNEVEGDPQIATFDQLREEGNPSEEAIPTTDETTEIPEDEETIYCIVCDREVDKNDIASCEREDCPFKQQEEKPTDEIEPDEEWFSNKPKEDKKEKHFIMMDSAHDHSNHNVKKIVIKEFTDLEGDYCLDCQKTISFEFDQKSWSSEDAKNWVTKHIKTNEIKNKSSEEIIHETLDKFPETVLKEWVDDKIEVKENPKIDFLPDNADEIINSVVSNFFDKFNNSSLMKRLKDLEA